MQLWSLSAGLSCSGQMHGCVIAVAIGVGLQGGRARGLRDLSGEKDASEATAGEERDRGRGCASGIDAGEGAAPPFIFGRHASAA